MPSAWTDDNNNDQPLNHASSPTPAANFLTTEIYNIGAQPGIRSLPPSPERDFLALTWGPVVYRTAYSARSDRLLPVYLRALSYEVQAAIPRRLPGTPKQRHLLETSYACKVFSDETRYAGAEIGAVRRAFHDWKRADLALPLMELPARLRVCLVVDEEVLRALESMTTKEEDEGSGEMSYGRCPVIMVEENFPDRRRRDSNPADGDGLDGWIHVSWSLGSFGSGVYTMDRYLSRKRARSPPAPTCSDEDSTDMKLARLASLFPNMALDALMEILLSTGGCVETATTTIQAQASLYPLKRRSTAGATPAIQTSLNAHMRISHHPDKKRSLTRKGKTLHLYSPEDIAAHTPCTIIHNFLPAEQANALLLELLDESQHFSRYRFQLFDRTVQSPHSASIYVATPEQHRQHTSEYTYGGTYRATVRQTTPHLRAVSGKVQQAVNAEIQHRIRTVYPGGRKLKYQSPKEWMPNAAFVNCYDGPTEAVGYHSDELTYLGPRAVIGSLSLGVEREFRVRRIVPKEPNPLEAHNNSRKAPATSSSPASASALAPSRADAQGQISIHLPHNSLLVMHAEMQEEWKHAIVPAQTISPHPLAGNRRINVTYRWYRDSLHPRYTPRCRCGAHTILRCVQRRRETRGRYMWMCYAGYAPGKKGCSFFQWADFNDDGEPLWDKTAVHDDAPWLENFVEGQDQLEAGVGRHVGNEKGNTSI
ncbi:hypothetical protein ASPACDRAFT_19843 [Aspergillus aculeatus ATCC 16872]|uniref:Uncharacterized protein n=1 Tax=Aspergillus aculeatus (strain ATCC 16872 / CBS 172.66 / WB 5094) TaxID=690307 RepID=A0A1L9X7S5_ASPA1|nr:uncharacterized protein ASPACDRAFT_19843 [Aspergillus aculeatus ATCC 16872]OJK04495.1 hypothetical protein ASPACDRAFT_19843 [Aspergillus aculeatus ATCC 16872]